MLGGMRGVPASARPELLGVPVLGTLTRLGWLDEVGVIEIDPMVSETAATQEVYGLEARTLINCVLVGGRREGAERLAACLVPAHKRVDVNGFVRKRLGVRKASFLPLERAVAASSMEYGGITAIGLPGEWPVLLDAEAAQEPLVVVGSGVRQSKLLVPGPLLARLPGTEVSAEVARPA